MKTWHYIVGGLALLLAFEYWRKSKAAVQVAVEASLPPAPPPIDPINTIVATVAIDN